MSLTKGAEPDEAHLDNLLWHEEIRHGCTVAGTYCDQSIDSAILRLYFFNTSRHCPSVFSGKREDF